MKLQVTIIGTLEVNDNNYQDASDIPAAVQTEIRSDMRAFVLDSYGVNVVEAPPEDVPTTADEGTNE